jgi:subtilisin family serine protease
MKLTRTFLVLLIVVFMGGCQQEMIVNEPDNDGLELKAAKITNLMVISRSEILPVDLESKLTAFGEIVSSTPEIGVVVLKPFDSGSKKQIEGLAEVKAVVPDVKSKWVKPLKVYEQANPPSIGDNETFFKYLWGMDAINAPEAWNAGYTGVGARVFILDSGIDADNPDLSPNLNKDLCKSFVTGENCFVRAGSYFNHGTHVAGTIAAADNKWGVIGVAPYAEIVAVKVLSEYTGSGYFSWINAGIVYAANNGADVINMSLGASFNRNGFYLDENNMWQKMPAVEIQNLIIAQQRAVNYALKKGAVVIVSAGNDAMNADGNASLIQIPADLQNVLAVAATAPCNWYYNPNTNLDIPASYTNFGKSLVAVAAPGGDFDSPEPIYYFDMIMSTGAGPQPSGAWSFYFSAGTSMAAPHVSGVAALIVGKNGGNMNPYAVTQQILKTAEPIAGKGTTAYFGKGRVNAYRAVTE